MARRLGLAADDVSSLEVTVIPPQSSRASVGVVGVVLALLTATSFARALQRSYELAWRLPRAGLWAAWRTLALVASNQEQYGLLGVAFTLCSWLSASAFIIVVATV
jgi:membrane protein